MRFIKSVLLCAAIIFCSSQTSSAMSFRGHMIDAGKNLTKGIIAPFKGIFYTGPQNIKKAYQYEVYGREKVEKRGLFRYKMFAFWRAPGEELKALIDGSVEAVSFGGDAIKNILSAIFSD